MAEIDSFLDSLLDQNKAPDVPALDDRYSKTLELKQIPSKGYGVLAKHAISVKDPICSVKLPTMIAIDSDFLPTTCYHCLVITASPLPLPGHGHVSQDLKTCNGCLVARYCNRECQVKSWHSYHKFECKIFKRLQGNLPPDIVRAVLRMVLLKDRGKVPDEEWSQIQSLTSNEEQLVSRGRSNLTKMAESIKVLAAASLSVEVIQKLLFIMKFNTIELPSPIYGGIGVMLDPTVARLNHSCEPNITIHRPQSTMKSGWLDSAEGDKTFIQFIPLRDIQKGEELLNCYVVQTEAVKARRAKLLEDYFFKCDCSKCLSDDEAESNFADEQSEVSSQFEQWTKNMQQLMSQVGRGPDAFQKVVATMDKSEGYLEYPVLYTTGAFPQMALKLILESLKAQAFDEALINILRIYFLVNPQRFVGRHSVTDVYTGFLMLDIFDVLLGISTISSATEGKVDKWLSNLSARGLSKEGLVYWRHRICADLRKRIEASAATDLLVLVEKREEKAQKLNAQKRDAKAEKSKDSAEDEMRTALKLKEPRWKIVLQENGC